MVALRKRVPTRMTLDEFLVWNPGDPRGWTWQLIDGEPAAMAPGSHADAVIQSEVARLLGNHLVDQRSPCHVVTEPGIVPRVGANRNYRVPDLGVTCAPPSNDPMVPKPVVLIRFCRRRMRRTPEPISGPTPPCQACARSSRSAARASRRNCWSATRTAPGRLSRRSAEPEIIGPADAVRLASIAFSSPLSSVYRTTALAADR